MYLQFNKQNCLKLSLFTLLTNLPGLRFQIFFPKPGYNANGVKMACEPTTERAS